MNEELSNARGNFTQGMSRISQFWGFPKAMGAIFAVIYLSPSPTSLDELVDTVNVSKGTVSTNVRALEHLGMIHKYIEIGERKDYYIAETDFWKIVRGILKERQKTEFDLAIRSVDESLQMLQSVGSDATNIEQVNFYQQRLRTLQSFFNSLDNLVAMLLALDNLRINGLERLLGKEKGNS
jgi:DNA-binding transcriptional regulator GbsR (MarR family)